MSQLVYTFFSPKSVEETGIIIRNTINLINGKITKDSNNVIKAKWRSKGYMTVFPVGFTFYIGKDMVRVVMDGAEAEIITAKRGTGGKERIWNEFVKKLCESYSTIDFGIRQGVANIEAIKFIGDGVEKVYTSTVWHSGSGGPFLSGGFSLGTTKSSTQFSNKVLAMVRYTNGATFEGELSKKSPVYHEIMANMSLYEK